MAIGGVVINFMAKTAEAVRDVGALNRKLKDTGDESKSANKKMGKLSNGLKTGLAAGAGIAAGAIVGLAGFMWDAGKAAWEDAQSAKKLEDALRKIPGVTDKAILKNEEWIGSMQMSTHVSDTELRVAVGNLTRATGDLEEAQKLVTLAVDASVGSGKSLDSVTQALAKAVNGNTGALQKMYPWLDKNHDGTVTLSEATQGLTDKFGGAAEAAADTDPFEKLKIIWDELKESLGKWLLPLLEKFAEWFKNPANQKKIQDFIEKAGQVATVVGTALVKAFQAINTWWKNNGATIKTWIGYFKTMGEWLGKIIKWVKDLVYWLGKVPRAGANLGNLIGSKMPWNNAATGGATGPSTYAATTTAATVQPPTVIVTEEQIYRAVSSLLMRGDARNGRLVRLA